jgi:WD40 repeat protein
LAYYDGSSNQASVVLWDCRTKLEVNRFDLNAPLRDLAFSKEGRLFTADLSRSNNIIVWDTLTGAALDRFTVNLANYAMGNVFTIAADGARFAVVPREQSDSVQVVDRHGKNISRFRVADELTTALAFSPDARWLITGGGYAESVIRLWDFQTGQPAGSLEGHRSWVGCLRFLPDGKTVASASADGTIRLWDCSTRQLLRTLRGNSGELWTIDVSPDGSWLASGCKDGSVSFWNLTSSTNRPPAFRTLPTRGSEWWEFSPDGRMIGVLEQSRLKLYNAATLRPLEGTAVPLTGLWSFGFSPDAQWLTLGDQKGRLAVWNLQSGRLLTNFPAHQGPVTVVSTFFTRDGRRLLTYGSEGMLKEWDAAAWTETRRWRIDAKQGANLASSPIANLVVTASRDGSFELIRTRSPESRRRLAGQNRTVAIDISHDGKFLAGASENGTVELWDLEGNRRLALMRGVLLGYHSVSISSDGERLAAGSNGREAMKIWDIKSHEEAATLQGDGSFFSYAAFSPDGNTVGARNWSGTVHLWSAPSWKEIELVEKARAGSPEEMTDR